MSGLAREVIAAVAGGCVGGYRPRIASLADIGEPLHAPLAAGLRVGRGAASFIAGTTISRVRHAGATGGLTYPH